MFVILKYCFQYQTEHVNRPGINYFDITAAPFFFGVAVFDFEGNNIIVDLHS